LHLPTQIIPIDKLIAKLTPRLALCDGLTLGGGEAIMQDSALDILRYFKKRGVHTCIETAGFADSARYTMFNPFVDTWLFGGLGNVSNAETIRNLGESEIIPTLPLIPGVADNNLQTLMDITIAAKAKQILLNPWNPYYNVYYKAAGIDMPFSPPDNIDITACLNKVTQFLVDNNINYKINSKN
jgi:pyruvate-formate lyase-activating enzyme